MNKEAANFEAIYKAKQSHDNSCTEPATGLGMCAFDMERLGWEEGDVVAKMTLSLADVQPSRFKLYCAGDHTNNNVTEGVEENVGASAPKVGEIVYV